MEKIVKFISLQEASQHCEYSQDYLSLRARQGKLRAQKQGRNWVTTFDWLKEYIEKTEGYKNGLDLRKNGYSGSADSVNAGRKLPAAPPSNLPGAERYMADDAPDERALNVPPQVTLRQLGTFAAVFGFAVLVISIGARPFGDAHFDNQIVRQAALIQTDLAAFAAEKFTQLDTEFREVKKMAERKRGLVVLPSTNSDEQTKAEIRNSFSDDVIIQPHDEESGIITPIFRERLGNEYLYLMVPVDNNEDR